jgi:chaperone required for assembly of F1-ATPase
VNEAPTPPRRFYNEASVIEAPPGFTVALDTRTLRTPGGRPFVAPTRALAALCAAEWSAQGEHIVPSSMPVSQYAFAAIDWTANSRDQLADYVASYAGTDLCCHRADSPEALARQQRAAWDPIVAWAETQLGARLPVVSGIIAADVDEETQRSLRGHAAALDDFRLTALAQATGLAGSALIGFALLRRELTAEAAFGAAALDNVWSLEKWGEDAEARARLERQRGEFEAIARFVDSLDGP